MPAQWTAGASLHRASQSFLSQECVWAAAHVDKNSTSAAAAPARGVRWDMCTHPGHLDRHLSLVIQKHGCVECNDDTSML